MVGAKRLESWHIEAAPKLRLVLHQGVGYHDTVATTALRDRQIPLAITPGGTPEGVAEHASMMMLAAGRDRTGGGVGKGVYDRVVVGRWRAIEEENMK